MQYQYQENEFINDPLLLDYTAVKREKVDEPIVPNDLDEMDNHLKSEQDEFQSSQRMADDSVDPVIVKSEPQEIDFDSSFGNISQVSGAPGFDVSGNSSAYSTPTQLVPHGIAPQASTSQHDQSFSPALPNVSRQDSNGQASDTQNSMVGSFTNLKGIFMCDIFVFILKRLQTSKIYDLADNAFVENTQIMSDLLV